MNYFNSNIKNISNDKLFDFLLTLVCSYDKIYNYKGEFIRNHIIDMCPRNELVFSNKVDFNEEDCKKGIYEFEYKILTGE